MALTKKTCRIKRQFVCTYRGYPICLEVITDYAVQRVFHESGETLYDSDKVISTRLYYIPCVKGGNINNSSHRYAWQYTDVEGAKGMIDLIESGKRIALTEKERRDWVLRPNEKAQWGFSKQSLTALINAYRKETSPRRRMGYLERLEDANFHTEYELLENGEYDELEKLIADTF